MATIADELFNDFEDSGSEPGDEQQNDHLFANNGTYDDVDGEQGTRDVDIELEDDEEIVADTEIGDAVPAHLKIDEGENEEETRARVEKLQLGGVSDVRSVAHLMKDLKPIVEVSPFLH